MLRSKNFALKLILLIFGAFFKDQKAFFGKTTNHQLWIIHFFIENHSKITKKSPKNCFCDRNCCFNKPFPAKTQVFPPKLKFSTDVRKRRYDMVVDFYNLYKKKVSNDRYAYQCYWRASPRRIESVARTGPPYI